MGSQQPGCYRVIADGPLPPKIVDRMGTQIELLPWSVAEQGSDQPVDALYTYGHPRVDGPMLDRLRGVRVISNFGVGVDHIRVAEATARQIVVGNTPGILDGATADMAFALLLAAGRRLVEGDQYARSPQFTHYDPSYMLGREIHGATLGIVGLGRIGMQIAKRARGFDMQVVYHNRRRRAELEAEAALTYVSFTDLLANSDYIVLSVPLTEETRGLIGRESFAQMKKTAILINIARGPVVDTEALTEALMNRQIYGAAVDVTDPEPLSRDHPLLKQTNLVLTPHLGSATEQTRERMGEVSVENLWRGLRGEPLLHQVG